MNGSFIENRTSNLTNTPAQGSAASFVFTVALIICTVSFNVFLCVVIAFSKRLKTIPNYFIINLCAADILISVTSMPVWVLFQVQWSDFATSFEGKPVIEMWIFVDIVCGTASICSLVCITVDRWVSISHPLRYMELMTARRAVLFVLLSWVYAVVVASLRNVSWPSKQGTFGLFALGHSGRRGWGVGLLSRILSRSVLPNPSNLSSTKMGRHIRSNCYPLCA